MSFDGVLAKDQEGGCNDIMLVDTKLGNNEYLFSVFSLLFNHLILN